MTFMLHAQSNFTRILMAAWIGVLGGLSLWQEKDTRREERQQAFATAQALVQQNGVLRGWNDRHGGVYVPLAEGSPADTYQSEFDRQLTTREGVRLAQINSASMTRQLSELAAKKKSGSHLHLTSLTPINPANQATDWEAKWLRSFEQGTKEQGEFYHDGVSNWFRYMVPLVVTQDCLACHAMQGYKLGDIRGGISVSLPFPDHTHTQLIVGYGSVTVLGLLLIFTFGSLYEKKQRLFEATFNNANPISVTDNDFNILMANRSYWAEFGPPPANKKTIKCYEHRPGKSCRTELCPLSQILGGKDRYVCEPSKTKDDTMKDYIITAKPLFDTRGKVVGVVESFQDITDQKRLTRENEALIETLRNALAQVKLLGGLIPICASCKKVRDDRGYWKQVEAYISDHSEAKFSHGICPDCVKKLYPDLYAQVVGNLPEHQGEPHLTDN